MLRCVKAELTKALRGRMFLIALAVGLLICGADVIESALAVKELTRRTLETAGVSRHCEGCSLFVRWIAVNGVTFGGGVFYFVWPILACLPYGWSYAEERQSGLYGQIVSRVGRRAYFVSKYAAVFISGGAAVALPVLADLLVDALICPAIVPEVATSLTPVTNGYFLSRMFYTAPWGYALIWCIVEFLWGGSVACLCLVIGTRFRHQAMALLVPFVGLILLDSVCTLLMGLDALGGGYYELSPLRLIAAAPASPNPGWLIFSCLGVFLAVTFIFGYREVVRRELP